MQRAFRLFAVFALAVSMIALTSPAQAATPTTCNGIPATITGTPGNDTLPGTPGDDVILGLAGADVIDGGGGNDIICGGLGDDTITGGDGNDVAYGAGGNDDLAGGDGQDGLYGGNGDDTLRGNQDNDKLVGSTGNDLLNGGFGNDVIRGNDGDDRGFGGPGIDIVEGGAGADSLSGADDDDQLKGNAGDDMLEGNAGDDLLYGGADTDTSDGGDGFDRCMGTETAIDCEDDDLNDPPVAVNDEFGTDEDQATGGNVLDDNGNGADYDPNGQKLAVVAVEGDEAKVDQPLTLPSGAEVTVNADGTFAYDPNGVYEHLNAGDFAVNTFEYTISDPRGETDEATVAVRVDGVNDAPVAADDEAGTPEDTPVSIDVLDNDTDVDSEISIASFTDPANGSVEEINGELVYTPDANTFGVDSFEYTITDGFLTDTATVTVTVGSVNDLPVAVDDLGLETNEDTPVWINVVDNDTDVEDDPAELTVTIVAVPANGSVALVAGGVQYTPNLNYFGADSFTYEVTDTDGGTSAETATVAINVTGVNDAPVAADDEAGTPEDTPVSIDVLDNDTDVDSEISIASFTDPANGSVEEINGELVYTPDANTFGVDSFEYTITDGFLTDTATVTVTVGSVNDLPVAVDDLGLETNEDTPVAISVVDNDTDVEDDPAELTVTIVTEPENGTVQLVDGLPVYTPNLNYNGPDSFTYEVTDTDGGTSAETATVAINVLPINDAPIAVDDLDVVTNEDTPVSIDVTDNDTDVDSEISIASFTDPANGSVEEINGELVYTPDTNFFGMDAFEYTITDGEYSDTATVTVTVGSVNDLPVAVDDLGLETNEDTPVAISVVDNDTDVEDDPAELTVTIVDEPANGSVVLVEGGVEYTPNADYNGEDSFTYEVTDTDGGTSAETATVAINVLPINDAPIAENDDIDASEDDDIVFGDLLADNGNGPDFDVDDDVLTIIAINGNAFIGSYTETLANGSIEIGDDGEIFFEPAELDLLGMGSSLSDTFEYTLTDGIETTTAVVTVTVFGENDAPVAEPDGPFLTDEESAIAIIGLANNDTDVDFGDLLSVIDVAPTSSLGAALMLNPDGSVTYNPAGALDFIPADVVATDTFEYTVADGNGGTDIGVVTVEVTGFNDAPMATADTPSTDEDTSVDIDVLGNDEDADDGAVLEVIALDFDTTLGTVSILPNNQVRYVPPPNYFGEDSFEYTMWDEHGAESSATVTVTVGSVNDLPVAVDDPDIEAVEDTPITIDVTANDTDVEDDPGDLTPSVVTGPEFGTVELVEGGVEYTPNPNYNGEDSFTYQVTDTDEGTSESTATVTINVTAVNDGPDAVDDPDVVTNEDTPVGFDVVGNDEDIDSEFSIDSFTPAANGLVVEGVETDFVYTPNENYNGVDTFTYTITDGEFTDTATVTVTVGSVNDLPVAVDDPDIEAVEDTPITIDVTANDTDVEDDPGDLTPSVVTGPEFGTVELVEGGVEYTPNPNYNGEDSFTYQVTDTDEGTSESTATVTINVTAVNDGPDAVDDPDVVTNEDTPVGFDVVGNDEDIDSEFSIDSFTPAANGLVVEGVETDFVYTPNENYNGVDTFTYTITDGEFTDTATVTVTVGSVNDLPVAVDDPDIEAVEDTPITIDVTANDTDVEDDPGDLTPSVVTGPEFGTVELVEGGVEYTPNPNYNGEDSFTYQVTDTDEGTSESTATVTINVTAVNDGPDAVDDPDVVTNEDTPVGFDVVGNDEDIDSEFSIDSFTPAANGLVVEGVETDFVYTPNENYNGVDTFTYTITDGEFTDTATVTVTVGSVNDLPVAVDDPDIEAVEDTPITIDVTANDTDVEDDPGDLTPSVVTGPEFGTVELVEGGVEYTPNPNYNGEDSFTYQVTDTDEGTSESTATVTINVTAVNDGPDAVDDPDVVTNEDTPVGFDVVGNDEDIDSEFSIDSFTPAANGLVVEGVETDFVYTPNENYNGVDTFTYTITDGEFTDTATVTVTVGSVNDLPVAVDDPDIEAVEDTPITIDVTANDTDVEDDPGDLTPSVVTGPEFGTVELVEGGVEYTPNPNYNGEDSFTYQVTDTDEGTSESTATVTINVTAVNDIPVAKDDSGPGYRLPTGESSFVTASVLDNDYDVDEDALTVAGIDVVGTAGFVTPGPGGTFTYENTGALPEGAEDSWDYRVIDGNGGEAWATVTIRINTVPVAGDDLIEAGEDDGVVDGSLLDNDDDGDGDDLAVDPIVDLALADDVTSMPIGVVSVDAAGNYTLTLDQGLQALNDGETVGTVFSYTIDDGFGGTATANVAVAVTGETDVEAMDDEFSGMALETAPPVILGNVADNDAGTDLTVTHVNGDAIDGDIDLIVTDGAAGSGIISVFADGRVGLEVLEPFGADVLESFTYTVADAYGSSDTATAEVMIYGNADLAQDDIFFANIFDEFQFVGNVLDNDVPGVSITRANGQDIGPDGISFFVPEPNGPGAADVYVDPDGTVVVDVRIPFESFVETGFWYTVEDALGRTDVAFAAIFIGEV